MYACAGQPYKTDPLNASEKAYRINFEKLLDEGDRLGLNKENVFMASDVENGVYRSPPPKDARYFNLYSGGRRFMAFSDTGSRSVSFMTRAAAKRFGLKIHRIPEGKELRVQGIHHTTRSYRDYVRISLDERKHGMRCVERVWILKRLAVGADILASWRLSLCAGLRVININNATGSYIHHASADRTRQNEIDFLLAEKNLLPGKSALDGYAYPINYPLDPSSLLLKPKSDVFEFDLKKARKDLELVQNDPYDATEDESCFLTHSVYAEKASYARFKEYADESEPEIEPTNNTDLVTLATHSIKQDYDYTTQEFYNEFLEPAPNPYEPVLLVNNEEEKKEEEPSTPKNILKEKPDIGDLTEAEASLLHVQKRIDHIVNAKHEVRLKKGEKKRFRKMLEETKDQFAKGEFDVGRFTGKFAVADIELKDPTIRHRARPYRQSPEKEKIIDKRIRELLKGGIIEPCASPFSSPVILVAKKNGEWRMCVDYRKLNRNTKTQTFPMRNISALLERIGQKKIFSSFDMRGGYYHMKLSDKMAKMGAFVTSKGQYQPRVLMFGFADAPAIFQRKMEEILGDLDDVEIYLDDIVVASDSVENHMIALDRLLKRCREADLKLHLKKCVFWKKKIRYLGHQIENGRLKIDPDYEMKILNMEIPKTQKELQKGLGLVNWLGAFIPRLSELTFPFHHLTSPKMKKSFKWTDQLTKQWQTMQAVAFDACKTELLQPDVSKPFILQTDASKIGMGAVLLQEHPDSKKWAPVSFWSKSFAPSTDFWMVAEKECCAVVKAFHHWRHLLIARDDTVVLTDHRNLVDLFNREKFHSPRMQRWAIFLSEFTFHAKFLKGSENYISDFLSRNTKQVNQSNMAWVIRNNPAENDGSHYALSPSVTKHFWNLWDKKICLNANKKDDEEEIDDYQDLAEKVASEMDRRKVYNQLEEFELLKTNDLKDENNMWNRQTLRAHQRNDPFLAPVILYLTKRAPGALAHIPHFLRTRTVNNVFDMNDNGLLVTTDKQQVVIPAPLRSQLIEYYHAGTIGAHLGTPKTIDLLRQRFYWVGMTKDTRKWIKTCTTCQEGKNYASSNKIGKLKTWHARERFQNISIDIVGPLPESSEGHKYLLTCQDRFSRFTKAYPLRKADGITVALTLFTKWICEFGTPLVVMSDQGSEFLNEVLQSCSRLCQMKQVFSTPYYPQSNGAIERFHRTLKTHLRCYFADKDLNIEHNSQWHLILPPILAAYNASKHSAKGVSPYYIVYGCQFRFPIDNAFRSELESDLHRKPSEKMNAWLKRLKLWHLYMNRQIRHHELQYDTSRLRYANKNRKPHQFAVGNIVMRKDEGKQGNLKKFGTQWVGPYVIYKLSPPNSVYMRRLDDKTERRTNTTKIKKWFPRCDEEFSWETVPIDLDKEDELLKKIIRPSLNRKEHHRKLREKLDLARKHDEALQETTEKSPTPMDVDEEPELLEGPFAEPVVEPEPTFRPSFLHDPSQVLPELQPMASPLDIFFDIPTEKTSIPKTDKNDERETEQKDNDEDSEMAETGLPIVFTNGSRVIELKAELRKRGLKIKGRKAVLIKRLNNYEAHRDEIHPVSFVKAKMFLPHVPISFFR